MIHEFHDHQISPGTPQCFGLLSNLVGLETRFAPTEEK